MKRSKLILDASCFPYRLGCNLAPRYDQSSDSQRIQVGEAPQMTRVRVLVVTGLLWMCGSLAAGEEGLFPFVVSYDTPVNATNVSAWLDRPAGVHGFIRAEDGHLRNDAGPVRFWATNICFEGCFPTHQQAERLAARLGVNCVRMHHMDNFSIWGDSPNKLTIDPRKLERLDYLIDQLEKRGVYTNLNLHVSRWLGEEEGFPGRSQAVGSTRLDWATITMTVIEGQGFDGPGRILIAATGLVQNKGAQLRTLDGKHVTVGDRWGEAPVCCEGIAAEILHPVAADRVTVYPLDTAGNRRSSVQPAARDGRAVIAIGPAYKTLWYEAELR